MLENIQELKQHEIPGRVAVATGNGGLAKIVVTTPASTAEIYPHGAHLTHFQLHGQPPLIFMSRKSWFAPDKPIRGGVPICFPWFGNREGQPSHGFARIAAWQLLRATAAPDGAVTLQFALPSLPGREAWHALRTEFTVTVAQTLTLELAAANESCGQSLEFENCLHTYFQVGDIAAVSLTGLHNTAYLDHAAGANGERKIQAEPALRIPRETNRVYLDTAAAVEIRDDAFRRTLRVEKFNSRSTVVWNPWTTQKLPDDFDPAEHQHMVCVESGNVKQDKVVLAPGQTSALKVVISSHSA